VSAAVAALHLGNEPEQATMLCIALGRAAGLQAGLVDRVFEALAVKCEAAGAHVCTCGQGQVGGVQLQWLLGAVSTAQHI
jgi:hypothetical protein